VHTVSHFQSSTMRKADFNQSQPSVADKDSDPPLVDWRPRCLLLCHALWYPCICCGGS